MGLLIDSHLWDGAMLWNAYEPGYNLLQLMKRLSKTTSKRCAPIPSELWISLALIGASFFGLYTIYQKTVPSVIQSVEAQTAQPANCQFTASFSGTGTGAAFQNLATGTAGVPCVTWRVTYSFPSTVTVLSIELDGAQSNAAGTGPSTFSVMNSNVTVGSNPSTNITTNPSFAVSQFQPWVQLKVGTFTGSGTVVARAYGYIANTTAGGATGPVGPTVPWDLRS